MNKSGINILVLSFLLAIGISASGQWSPREAEPTGFEFRNLGAFRVSAWVGELAIPLNPGEKHKTPGTLLPGQEEYGRQPIEEPPLSV